MESNVKCFLTQNCYYDVECDFLTYFATVVYLTKGQNECGKTAQEVAFHIKVQSVPALL